MRDTTSETRGIGAMSYRAALFLACTWYASGLQAAPGRVVEVTLHPRGAQLVREIPVPAGEGPFSLVVDGLSDTVLPASLAVSADAGMEVRELRLIRGSDAERLDRQRHEQALQRLALENEHRMLQRRRRALDDKLGQLEAMQARAGDSAQADLRHGLLQHEAFQAVLSTSFEQRDRLAAEAIELDALAQRLEQRQAELESVSARLQAQPPRRYSSIVIDGVRDDGSAGVLRLEYGLQDVGWRTGYRVDVQPMSGEATLTTLAHVHQASGETWQDVRLRMTSAPWFGARAEAVAAVGSNERAMMRSLDPGALRPLMLTLEKSLPLAQGWPEGVPGPGAPLPSDRRAAWLQLFELLGTERPPPAMNVSLKARAPFWLERSGVTLASGDRPQRLALEVRRLPLHVHGLAVPVQGPEVHRIGVLENTLAEPLSAGPVEVYFDGRFQGEQHIPLTEPGERIDLALGMDPGLRARRVLLDRDERVEVGRKLISVRYALQVYQTPSAGGGRAVDVTETMPIRLFDRIPLAGARSRIRVELDEVQPALSPDPQYARRGRPRGVLRWDFEAADLAFDRHPGTPPGRSALVFVEYAYTVDFDRSFELGLGELTDFSTSE
ncbi:MAG: DUF4139 domain-containing protein [Gammaproteobacteria bacterium]|nr:DUF4139 domain-containing protein [Gammaproteobacteria bacterium]